MVANASQVETLRSVVEFCRSLMPNIIKIISLLSDYRVRIYSNKFNELRLFNPKLYYRIHESP